ncbi:cation transporting ATPase C-terminal domain-containing protein [Streptomyces sp. NPDC054840]
MGHHRRGPRQCRVRAPPGTAGRTGGGDSRAALRDIGLFTNPLLLAGIAFELAFTAALVYAPPLQGLFGTAALPLDVVALIATSPFSSGAPTNCGAGSGALTGTRLPDTLTGGTP